MEDQEMALNLSKNDSGVQIVEGEEKTSNRRKLEQNKLPRNGKWSEVVLLCSNESLSIYNFELKAYLSSGTWNKCKFTLA